MSPEALTGLLLVALLTLWVAALSASLASACRDERRTRRRGEQDWLATWDPTETSEAEEKGPAPG